MQNDQSFINRVNIVTPEVIKAAEETEKQYTYSADGYTTELGVHLKYRKVPSQVLYKAWASLEPPQVPKFWIEDWGREEPNPNAPSYLEALAIYHHKRTHLTTFIYFMRGIDIVSIPDEVYPPESDEWYAGLEDIVDIPDKVLPRKAIWLMYYAVPGDDEQAKIINDLMIKSGMIPEKLVTDIMDSFRDSEGSEADNGSQSTEGNPV